jgi:polyhydroxyalkanoate synthesis regulator protein
MAMFMPENKAAIAEIKAKLAGQLVPGSALDKQAIRLYGAGIAEVLPGFNGISDEDIMSSANRISNESAEAAGEIVSETYPDQSVRDSQAVQGQLIQNAQGAIDLRVQQALDTLTENPPATPEEGLQAIAQANEQAATAIISELSRAVDQIRSGNRPYNIPSDITAADLEAVIEQIMEAMKQRLESIIQRLQEFSQSPDQQPQPEVSQ